MARFELLAHAKDCPFCGSVVLAQEGFHLTCLRCGADGPDADSLAVEAVVAAWNRRAPTLPVPAGA